MPVEVAVWSINGDSVRQLEPARMDREARLQRLIINDLDIVEPGMLLIASEVTTDWGGRIDILAMREDGNPFCASADPP